MNTDLEELCNEKTWLKLPHLPARDEEIESDGKSRSNLIYGLIVCLILIVLILCNVINVSGIIIATASNSTAQCYENKFVLSLPNYIIINCNISLIFSILITLAVIMTTTCIIKYYFLLSTVYAIYCLIITILGIIELSYQYQKCKVEEKNVCIMMIIVVVVNLLYLTGGCTVSIKIK